MCERFWTLPASSEQEINAAFSTVAKSSAGALLVGGGAFFNGRASQMIGLAAVHAIPASYFSSGFVGAGGLVSYGASPTEAYRLAGVYVTRILKGEKLAIFP
ncbi:MAG: ABC transporter substrate-binding protein, partial [Pseudolabrys sp.]